MKRALTVDDIVEVQAHLKYAYKAHTVICTKCKRPGHYSQGCPNPSAKYARVYLVTGPRNAHKKAVNTVAQILINFTFKYFL